jgi:hypothetical protein
MQAIMTGTTQQQQAQTPAQQAPGTGSPSQPKPVVFKDLASI